MCMIEPVTATAFYQIIFKQIDLEAEKGKINTWNWLMKNSAFWKPFCVIIATSSLPLWQTFDGLSQTGNPLKTANWHFHSWDCLMFDHLIMMSCLLTDTAARIIRDDSVCVSSAELCKEGCVLSDCELTAVAWHFLCLWYVTFTRHRSADPAENITSRALPSITEPYMCQI